MSNERRRMTRDDGHKHQLSKYSDHEHLERNSESTSDSISGVRYVLNKLEFRDSVVPKVRMEDPNTPMYCSSGKRNGVDHALTCALGGNVIIS